MNALCIYHANCPDGFTAAWLVDRYSAAAGVTVDHHPGVYGEEPPDCTGRHVIMVDFTYGPEQMLAIAEQAKTLVVLDHHQTALANCAPLDVPRYTGRHVIMVLDMDRSGAMITWDYVHPGVTPPDIVSFVQDRDLWRFAMNGTADYFAAMTSRPYTFEAWDELANTPLDEVLTEGGAINRYRDQLIALILATAAHGEVGGVLMPVVNCPYAYASDVAGELAKQTGVAAYYFDNRATRQRSWGLRSTDDGPDVAKLAEKLGGGGHRHASGFRTPLPEDE